jgi:integrase
VKGTTRYKSEVSAQALFAAAQRELCEGACAIDDDAYADRKEQFKILVLALGAGLRRDEIDTLTWGQINFETRQMRIETNAYTSLKSADSEDEVDIDESVLEIMRHLKNGGLSDFVINSEVKPRTGTTYHHYRCQRHFNGLIEWLRGKGITARNPIHALRKEFGSLICAQAGIYVASHALRHSDIRITRDSYLDRKERVVVKLGLETSVQPSAV